MKHNPFNKPEILENNFENEPSYQASKKATLFKLQSIMTNRPNITQSHPPSWKPIKSIFNYFSSMHLKTFLASTSLSVLMLVIYIASLGIYGIAQENTNEVIVFDKPTITSLLSSDECSDFDLKAQQGVAINSESLPNEAQEEMITKSITFEIPYSQTNNQQNPDSISTTLMVNCYGKIDDKQWSGLYQQYKKDVEMSKPSWLDYQACGVNKMLRFWKEKPGYICTVLENESSWEDQSVYSIPFLSAESYGSIKSEKVAILNTSRMGNEFFWNTDSRVYFVTTENVLYSMEYYTGAVGFISSTYNVSIEI